MKAVSACAADQFPRGAFRSVNVLHNFLHTRFLGDSDDGDIDESSC